MDWPRFEQLVKDYNVVIGDRANLIFCELMYRTCPQKNISDYMVGLMKPIVTKEFNYKNCLIYATLLLRTGKNQQAEEYFSKAMALDGNGSDQKTKQEAINDLKKLVLDGK